MMSSSSAAVRLRDIPEAGTKAWIFAFGAATGFALVGVMLAVFAGANHVVTSTTTNAGMAVFGAITGLLNLAALDRQLREVSE